MFWRAANDAGSVWRSIEYTTATEALPRAGIGFRGMLGSGQIIRKKYRELAPWTSTTSDAMREVFAPVSAGRSSIQPQQVTWVAWRNRSLGFTMSRSAATVTEPSAPRDPLESIPVKATRKDGTTYTLSWATTIDV